MEKNLITPLGVAAVLFSCAGTWVQGQESPNSRSGKKEYTCLTDLIGPRAKPQPDPEWLRRNPIVSPGTFANPPLAASLVAYTNILGAAPAGTERMYQLRPDPIEYNTQCVQASKMNIGALDDGFTSVFDVEFLAGAGTSYIQVLYTCQANIGTGVAPHEADGMMLQIKVTQGGTTVYCANTDSAPFMVRQSNKASGLSASVNMSSYVGYVAASPNLNTRVQVQIATLLYGPTVSVATACANNLIIRY